MLPRVIAAEYVRPMDSGRTCPLLIHCERSDGSIVTTVGKFSDFCDLKETHLTSEVVAACLAGGANALCYPPSNSCPQPP